MVIRILKVHPVQQVILKQQRAQITLLEPYKLTANLKVWIGVGISFKAKAYAQLTSNAKAHATSEGALKVGTKVDVSDTIILFIQINESYFYEQSYLFTICKRSLIAQKVRLNNWPFFTLRYWMTSKAVIILLCKKEIKNWKIEYIEV